VRQIGESDESSTSMLVVARAVANCTLWRMISHAISILISISLLVLGIPFKSVFFFINFINHFSPFRYFSIAGVLFSLKCKEVFFLLALASK
jgi:hypothetical protein